MATEAPPPPPAVSAVLADVDGTLVTSAKALTPRAVAAARRLHELGVAFAITSGRPPRGMAMLVEPLAMRAPMAAFNGGVVVAPDLSVLEERTIPDDVAPAVVEVIRDHGLDAWIYRSTSWYVTDERGPHVDREAALRERFGAHVSAARSQPYYVDVTHPMANKGVVVERLATSLGVPLADVATLGDQPNDVLMFERSGLSIAMGNASADVQQRATYVTASNDDDGFALAIERYVLPRAAAAPPAR
jgi:HAD superfamily hydrolase (TIGR01484 family)